jgi:HEAT repeat protein
MGGLTTMREAFRASLVGALALALTLAISAYIAPRAAAQTMSEDEYRNAMQQLRGGTPEERTAAAEILGRRAYRQRDQIAPVLRELIRSDTDWRVRASAGRALGRLGTRDAVPDLVRALRDPVVDVRVVAAAAIWRLPDPAGSTSSDRSAGSASQRRSSRSSRTSATTRAISTSASRRSRRSLRSRARRRSTRWSACSSTRPAMYGSV